MAERKTSNRKTAEFMFSNRLGSSISINAEMNSSLLSSQSNGISIQHIGWLCFFFPRAPNSVHNPSSELIFCSLFHFQLHFHSLCSRERYDICFRTVKTRIKNSNGALTSLYILGTSFKGRKYYERQIRKTVFFQWGGICKFSL